MPTSYYIIWYLMFIQGTGYNLGLNIKRRSFKQKKVSEILPKKKASEKSIKRRRYFKINYRGWRWTLDLVLWSWV